jgi:hypothetical protein
MYDHFCVLTRVFTECSVMHCNKSCSFFTLYSFFLIKHALSTFSVSEDYTCINGVLCWDCKIIIYLFIYSAKLWAEKVDRLCTMEEAGFLHYKFLC